MRGVTCVTLLSLLGGCGGERFVDRDPGGEVAFTGLLSRGGFIHAAASFHRERNQHTHSGVVNIDARALFLEGQAIRHPTQSASPNIAHWQLDAPVFAFASGHAVGIDSAGTTLFTRSLGGLAEPAMAHSVMAPEGARFGEPKGGDDRRVWVPVTSDAGEATRIYRISDDGTLELEAEGGVSCAAAAVSGERLYCAAPVASTARVDVLRIDPASRRLMLLSSITDLGGMQRILGVHALDAMRLAVVGLPEPFALRSIHLDASGTPVLSYQIAVPDQRRVNEVMWVSSRAGMDRLLIATPLGVLLADVEDSPSSGNAAAQVVSTYPDDARMLSPYDAQAGLYMWTLGRFGMVLVRVTENEIQKVGGYYRKFGDQFLTYDTLSEGKY